MTCNITRDPAWQKALARQKEIGGFDFDYGCIMDEAAAFINDGEIAVELGTFLGVSSIYFAEAVRQRGKSIRFFTVDYFGGYAKAENYHSEFMKHICACGVRDLVRPIQGVSWEAASYFRDGEVSFCWVDAGHDYESVAKDLTAWMPKMRAGGLIGGHDYSEPDVRRAVDEVLSMYALKPKIISPSGWESWLCTLGK